MSLYRNVLGEEYILETIKAQIIDRNDEKFNRTKFQIDLKPVTPKPLKKSFATFGLGSNS